MEYLKNDYMYSDQQKDLLENAITNDIEIEDMKNPGMPTHVLEAYIELRKYGYNIEFLEDHKIANLSLVYLDCIKCLARNGIDVYQLIYGDEFINYNDRQILTVTDGLLSGIDLHLFGKVTNTCIEMRNIIDTYLYPKVLN